MESTFQEVIGTSSILAAEGNAASALCLLDRALVVSESAVDSRSILVLARHAAVISEYTGDLKRAERYLRLALTHRPEDLNALYMIGNIYDKLGDTSRAQSAFTACLRFSHCQGNQAMLELLATRGYQIADGQGSETNT